MVPRSQASLQALFCLLVVLLSAVCGSQSDGDDNFSTRTFQEKSEFKILPGHTRPNVVRSKLPFEYIKINSLPSSFSWSNVDGTNYLTKSLNQHIPQYCKLKVLVVCGRFSKLNCICMLRWKLLVPRSLECFGRVSCVWSTEQ